MAPSSQSGVANAPGSKLACSWRTTQWRWGVARPDHRSRFTDSGASGRQVLPDFLVDVHAAVEKWQLLTPDGVGQYVFPTLEVLVSQTRDGQPEGFDLFSGKSRNA